MSTTKTVKVTNGKILNYTITKPGYKTVHGSKLITADTTINVNMIAESDTREVYTIGDRLGGVATFFTYYTDGNGNKYAVFVVDAQYRATTKWASDRGMATGLPSNTLDFNVYKTEAGCPLSATYCSQYVFDTHYPAGTTSNPFPGFKYAKDCVSIPALGTAGIARMPNPFEVWTLWQMGTVLDSYDPTVTDYAANNLTNKKDTMTCYPRTDGGQYIYYYSSGSGSLQQGSYTDDIRFNIPVFEIPVNN